MLRKTMEVLEVFSSTQRELGVVEVSELLHRPKSTVSRWLTGMEDAGFLERDPDSSRFRLSLRLTALGDVARHTTSLQRLARPTLSALALTTGETANLTVLVGLEAVNIEVADSPRPVMHIGWVGRRLPVHATAAGKALLAYADKSTVSAVLRRGLEEFTPHTITRSSVLRAELSRVQARGYATVFAELEPDLAAVGAPVRDHRGVVVAAIAIGGPISRCPRRELSTLAVHVLEAGQALSARLGYRGM